MAVETIIVSRLGRRCVFTITTDDGTELVNEVTWQNQGGDLAIQLLTSLRTLEFVVPAGQTRTRQVNAAAAVRFADAQVVVGMP